MMDRSSRERLGVKPDKTESWAIEEADGYVEKCERHISSKVSAAYTVTIRYRTKGGE